MLVIKNHANQTLHLLVAPRVYESLVNKHTVQYGTWNHLFSDKQISCDLKTAFPLLRTFPYTRKFEHFQGNLSNIRCFEEGSPTQNRPLYRISGISYSILLL